MIYFVFSLVFVGVCATMCKYTTSVDNGGIVTPINLGSSLYFFYKRQSIGYGETGNIIPIELTCETIQVQGEDKECIVVYNIKPGDNIIYNFQLFNYRTQDDNQSDPMSDSSNVSVINTVNAEYHVTIYAEVQIPIVGEIVAVDCNISLRRNTDTAFSDYTSDRTVSLFPYQYSNLMIDTYQVEINVREQQYQAEDYFGASLTVYIFIDAIQRTS